MDKNIKLIINHLKNFGFIYAGSEIYGGIANSWDYGPLGSKIKNNIRDFWLRNFVDTHDNIFLVDTSIFMNNQVWEASGHVKKFNDKYVSCLSCKKQFQLDKIISSEIDLGQKNSNEIGKILSQTKCLSCGKSNFGEIQQFNSMFKTNQSITGLKDANIYLRPETSQGTFINFKNIQRSLRLKLPFGIANIGKAFRNEITPGNFIFRTREFEQMELQFFINPFLPNSFFDLFKKLSFDFMALMGINKSKLRFREHPAHELAHYSNHTVDIEYHFPFGWGEISGISDRGTFDLESHSQSSNEDLQYLDPITNQKYFPSVIEPTFGLNRILLAVLIDAFVVEHSQSKERIVLKLDKKIAPYKIAVLPLTKKLSNQAKELFKKLLLLTNVVYDDSGSIGKRYWRQDAIGTPFCLTFDFQSENDNTVTIRDRDSMEQKRIPITQIDDFLKDINNLWVKV